MARSGTGRRVSTASRSSPGGERRNCGGWAFPATPTTRTAATSKRKSNGVIFGSIYLPNGNPVGTEKFDYNLSLDGAADGAMPGS